MITKFKLFESKEDDYYTVLIKLEEISRKLRIGGSHRLLIQEKIENEYIIYTYTKRSAIISKYEWDQTKKEYVEDQSMRDKYVRYKEKIKIDTNDLIIKWLEVDDKLGEEKYRLLFYYAPDELKFENVDELIRFLDLRYWKDALQWDGEPRKHPIGRRKFYWDESPRYNISLNDPYGEEEWEYEYPYDEED